MATGKRNNAYWAARLKKDGHADLLTRVNAGEITMYKATQAAGYRAKGPGSPAATLSHHWKRASADERKRFVTSHLKEVNRVVREVRADLIAMQAQKLGGTAGK